jgi:hypothetical protein
MFLHLVIHEIQVVKPSNYTFGFGDGLDTFPFGDAIKDWAKNKKNMQRIVRMFTISASNLWCKFFNVSIMSTICNGTRML